MGTLRVAPDGFFHTQYSSNTYWKNYNRLYDNDLTTHPTSQSGYIMLTFNLNALPQNVKLTAITAYLQYKRGGSDMPTLSIGKSTKSNYDSTAVSAVKSFSLPNGTYNVSEMHSTRVTLTDEESNIILNAPYLYTTLNSIANSTAYELYFDFEYEELNNSKIYIGSSKSKEVYVGGTKAKAVYIGNTKIL